MFQMLGFVHRVDQYVINELGRRLQNSGDLKYKALEALGLLLRPIGMLNNIFVLPKGSPKHCLMYAFRIYANLPKPSEEIDF